MIDVDLDELADWNFANKRARNAYYRDPTALSDLLAKVCFACRNRNHGGCTGHIRGAGRCSCWTDHHLVTPERTPA